VGDHEVEGVERFVLSNLRKRWLSARSGAAATHPLLRDFSVKGIEVLRLLALKNRQASASKRDRLKNVADGYVIRLEPREVQKGWTATVREYDAAIAFLKKRCGVVGRHALPSVPALLPLAYALTLKPRRAGFLKDLERWFWATTFLQTYGRGGTNTLVPEDAEILERWNKRKAAVPSAVVDFDDRFSADSLLDPLDRNRVLRNGVLALQTVLGAKDWKDPELKIVEIPDPVDLQVHHVFPQSRTKAGSKGKFRIPGDPRTIINFVLIRKLTNQQIGNSAPDALSSHGVDYDYVETHQIDEATLKNWIAFVVDRVETLEDLIKKQVKA
jgi:hypothetical protein